MKAIVTNCNKLLLSQQKRFVKHLSCFSFNRYLMLHWCYTTAFYIHSSAVFASLWYQSSCINQSLRSGSETLDTWQSKSRVLFQISFLCRTVFYFFFFAKLILWPHNLSHNITSAGLVNENDGTSHSESLAVWSSTCKSMNSSWKNWIMLHNILLNNSLKTVELFRGKKTF